MTVTTGGLHFVALGGFQRVGTDYIATGTVAVGFDPGSDAFKPVLQLKGEVIVDADDTPTFSLHGKVFETLTDTPIELLDVNRNFDINTLINDGLSELDGEKFSVAGVNFDFDTIKLVNGTGNVPEIEFQGSLSVAGLTVSVNGSNMVEISESGVILTGVEATLNGSTTIGGVTFDANQLSITYASTGGNDIFTVTGDTSFTFESSTVQVDWGGTTTKETSTAGLVFENGSLKSLDMAVTATVTVAAVDFSADDLVITYTEATATFTMTGEAGFKLVQDDSHGNVETDVSVDFGGTANGHETAGLVIVNGELTRLDMTIDASFQLFSLSLATPGLVVEYQATPAERFVMYGTIALTSATQSYEGTTGKVFNGVAATLGDKSSPGLVIVNGIVEDVNVTVNGSFNLFSLTVAPHDLNVKYTRSSSTVDITGGLDISLAGAFKASTELFDGGVQIDTQTGTVTIHGVKLDLSDVNLGAFTIQHFQLDFKDHQGETDFDASLILTFSGGWSVGGSIGFVDGEINEIGVDYQAGASEGIELGPSGLFLTGFKTKVEHIATGVLTVKGSIEVDYGPHIMINGQSVAIITAKGDFLIDSKELKLTKVDVSVADGIIATGTGSLIADWAAGDFSLDSSLSIFDGVIVVDGSFQFNSEGDFLLVADATVQVPESVPVIGGKTLGSMDFAFKYLNDNGNPSGFIAAWATISILGYDQAVGIEYAIDGSISSGSFSLLGNDGVQDVENQLSLPTLGGIQPVNFIQIPTGYQPLSYAFGDAAPSVGQVLNVPEGTTTISLALNSPAGLLGYAYLLTPPYTTVSYDSVLMLYAAQGNLGKAQSYTFPGTNLTANYIVRQDTSNSTTVLIQAQAGQTLPAGQYAIFYVPQAGAPAPTAINSFVYSQPTANRPVPGVASGLVAPISATGQIAAPLAGTTTVSFYATTSPTKPQGLLIGEATVANGGLTVNADGTFTANLNWNNAGSRANSSYIYAVVKDGVNPPVVSANSPTPIVLQPVVKGLVAGGSQPIGGATVQIYFNADPNNLPATPNATAVTATDGSYSFRTDQPASVSSPLNFVVNLLVPAGYTIDSPTAITGSYTGSQAATINYTLKPSASIIGDVANPPANNASAGVKVPISGATVFLDLNHNGTLDPGEPATYSDSDGRYGFLNLDPGAYHVVIETPDGYTPNTPTSQDVTVADEHHRVSGVNFNFANLDTTPALSTPIYPNGGQTFGPIVTTSVSGIAANPRGSSEIQAVLVSIQDLNTGLYWNGRRFTASATPIQLTAEGTTSWRLAIDVSTLISGHTYQIGSSAIDAQGYNQASPAYQTFTYQGPPLTPLPTVAPTMTVMSSQPVSVLGQPVVFNVTLAPVNGSMPTGNIWLLDGATILASLPLQNGQASFQTSSLMMGIHTIQVYYSGDTNFLGGIPATITQNVEQIVVQSDANVPAVVRASLGSKVIEIGGAAAGAVEQIELRSLSSGRFVQIKVMQPATGSVVYQGVFRSLALKGIVVYDGPGEEFVKTIGRLPVPVWMSRSGTLTPLSIRSGTAPNPFRNRLPRFRNTSAPVNSSLVHGTAAPRRFPLRAVMATR